MSSEEQKVSLVVQGDHLSALELGHRGKEGLEESSDGVTEAGNESV